MACMCATRDASPLACTSHSPSTRGESPSFPGALLSPSALAPQLATTAIVYCLWRQTTAHAQPSHANCRAGSRWLKPGGRRLLTPRSWAAVVHSCAPLLHILLHRNPPGRACITAGPRGWGACEGSLFWPQLRPYRRNKVTCIKWQAGASMLPCLL